MSLTSGLPWWAVPVLILSLTAIPLLGAFLRALWKDNPWD